MSSSVKTIKFTIILSLLLIIITYLITVNIELHFVELNSRWISNNFLLTVFGGAFGSTIVVLICELHKYWLLKRDMELKIYTELYRLLAEIIVSNNSIRTYLKDSKMAVQKNTLEASREKSQAIIESLETTDYRSFSGKDKIERAMACFFQGAYQNVKIFISDEQFLYSAVIMDKIDLLEHGQSCEVTSACKNTKKTLDILLATGEASANSIKIALERIDTICNGRFKWAESKQMIESFNTVLSLDEYEKFISRGDAFIMQKKQEYV